MKKLLLFQFEVGGDVELIAHFDILHAIMFFCEQSNIGIKDFEEADLVKEMWFSPGYLTIFSNIRTIDVTKLIKELKGKPGIIASTRCES